MKFKEISLNLQVVNNTEMKFRISTIIAFMLLMLSLTGCDFLRTLAGRPTSADLAVHAERIARHEEGLRREQAVKDSLATVQKALEAKEAAAASIGNLGYIVQVSDQVKSLNGIRLEHEYGLMIGTYHNVDNAVKLAESIREQGFPTDVIRFFSGAVAIATCATDDPVEFIQYMEKVKGQSFCRPDAWIIKKSAE